MRTLMVLLVLLSMQAASAVSVATVVSSSVRSTFALVEKHIRAVLP